MSVAPSRPLATNRSGQRPPRSPAPRPRRPPPACRPACPSSALRSSVTGGWSTRDQVSMRYRSPGDHCTWCVPSPSVRTVRPRAVEIRRGKSGCSTGPARRGSPPALNQTCRLSSSTSIHVLHHPLAWRDRVLHAARSWRRTATGGSSRPAPTSRSSRRRSIQSAEVFAGVIDERLAVLVDDRRRRRRSAHRPRSTRSAWCPRWL